MAEKFYHIKIRFRDSAMNHEVDRQSVLNLTATATENILGIVELKNKSGQIIILNMRDVRAVEIQGFDE